MNSFGRSTLPVLVALAPCSSAATARADTEPCTTNIVKAILQRGAIERSECQRAAERLRRAGRLPECTPAAACRFEYEAPLEPGLTKTQLEERLSPNSQACQPKARLRLAELYACANDPSTDGSSCVPELEKLTRVLEPLRCVTFGDQLSNICEAGEGQVEASRVALAVLDALADGVTPCAPSEPGTAAPASPGGPPAPEPPDIAVDGDDDSFWWVGPSALLVISGGLAIASFSTWQSGESRSAALDQCIGNLESCEFDKRRREIRKWDDAYQLTLGGAIAAGVAGLAWGGVAWLRREKPATSGATPLRVAMGHDRVTVIIEY